MVGDLCDDVIPYHMRVVIVKFLMLLQLSGVVVSVSLSVLLPHDD